MTIMPSNRNDLNKIIVKKTRRLQILKEQAALQGIDTPPHIIIEIEDLMEEIDELETQLENLNEHAKIEEMLILLKSSTSLNDVLFELEQFASERKLNELKKWVTAELEGYIGRAKTQDQIPEYRRLSVEWIDLHNQPIIINDARLSFLRYYRMPHSVRDLQGSIEKGMVIQPTNVLDLLGKLSGGITIYGGRVESSKINVLLDRIRAEAIRRFQAFQN